MNTKNLLKSLDNFNSNKYLLGISLLMLNIGSKYLIVDLSNSTQQLLKLKIIRRFTIFSIFFIGTRNVSTSIILTGFFIIFSEGLFNENFKESKGKIAYQTACHQRVQNFGPKTKSILSKIPESEITMIERCSGHDGTYAIKLESFENSIKIRRPVVSRIKKDSYKIFTSDCPMAAKHISNDLDNNEIEVKLHPISILKSAYGI